MSQLNKKNQPQQEQQEERISWFNTVVPKKKRVINRKTDMVMQFRNSLVEDDSDMPLWQKVWYNTSFQKYLRLLVFFGLAFLICFIGYKYFNLGRVQPRQLPKTNTARLVVFPDCTFEMLENDMSNYPGVIGAVAAYDANGELAGYAYDTFAAGAGGEVLVTVGVSVEGSITQASLTSHHEVKGLGTSAGNLFIASFAGRAADASTLDDIVYMQSSPETSENIVNSIKNAMRHANEVYGIVGREDVEQQQAVTEDITSQNTFDTPELRALLPDAVFAGYYPEKGYPLKGFKYINMAYYANTETAEYRAVDMTVDGVDGPIVMSVAVDADRRIANVVLHSHQEKAFEDETVLNDLIAAMIGCDYADLSRLELDGDARVSGNVVTNGATDAISFVKEYMELKKGLIKIEGAP